MRARSGLGVLNALGTQAFHMDNRAEALLKGGITQHMKETSWKGDMRRAKLSQLIHIRFHLYHMDINKIASG